ncbi:MAG: tetratricopeptide repeat protein [Alphaproteobacteria bacterium]
MHKITHYLVLALLAGQMSACQTTGTDAPETSAAQNKAQRIDAAIEKTAIRASKNGSVSANLLAVEKKYKRNASDPDAALAYAQSLRQANHLNRADIVLEPFTRDDTVYAGVNTEMSMIKLAMGDYDMAEKFAKDAILQDAADYEAYQNLGISLDAKEMHPEAERAFRKGLEHWQGDPTTIMNNLALNLATQGFIDEAVEVLERAKALSPNRIELERNLRIIRTLNER